MEASGFWQQNKLQVDGKQRHYTDTAMNIVWYKWQKKNWQQRVIFLLPSPHFPRTPGNLDMLHLPCGKGFCPVHKDQLHQYGQTKQQEIAAALAKHHHHKNSKQNQMNSYWNPTKNQSQIEMQSDIGEYCEKSKPLFTVTFSHFSWLVNLHP